MERTHENLILITKEEIDSDLRHLKSKVTEIKKACDRFLTQVEFDPEWAEFEHRSAQIDMRDASDFCIRIRVARSLLNRFERD